MSPYLFILCMERLSRNIEGEVILGRWNPLRISRNGPKLSHLFFADDLTLFATVDTKIWLTINTILQQFHSSSGQKVSLHKSRVIYSKNYPQNIRDLCSANLRISEPLSFGKYLGFPIFHQKPTNKDFQPIIDIMRKKLAGWKGKTLNMVGRLVLVKSSLEDIPSHIMSYSRLLARITKTIDKVSRDFLWGSTEEKRRPHLVKWETIT